MENRIRIFDSPQILAVKLAEEFKEKVQNSKVNFYIAISGGSTPKIFFKELAKFPFKDEIDWERLQIFWCDERCVPPNDSDSNFRMTKECLFDFVNIPNENIHRIKGESHPEKEAVLYSKEIERLLPKGKNNFPQFDWVLLGIGEDGHTASLFPHAELLYSCSNIAGVAEHPVSGQKRISLTERVINNSKRISFIVTGKDKANILHEVIDSHDAKIYPASKIKPTDGILDWWIDKEAAFYL